MRLVSQKIKPLRTLPLLKVILISIMTNKKNFSYFLTQVEVKEDETVDATIALKGLGTESTLMLFSLLNPTKCLGVKSYFCHLVDLC